MSWNSWVQRPPKHSNSLEFCQNTALCSPFPALAPWQLEELRKWKPYHLHLYSNKSVLLRNASKHKYSAYLSRWQHLADAAWGWTQLIWTKYYRAVKSPKISLKKAMAKEVWIASKKIARVCVYVVTEFKFDSRASLCIQLRSMKAGGRACGIRNYR